MYKPFSQLINWMIKREAESPGEGLKALEANLEQKIITKTQYNQIKKQIKIIMEITSAEVIKETRTFGTALEALKSGYKLAREGWNGKNMWIKLQTPDENSKMSLPYLYMFTADKKQVPWLASQTDILAEDWSIVE